MQNNNRVDVVVVKKIIEYCDRVDIIIRRFGSSLENFITDDAFQLSIGMCIVQIGELTKRFSDEFKRQHSDILWHSIKAMRNIFVHEYEKVDFESVWKILSEDVPELKAQLEQIISAEGEANEN